MPDDFISNRIPYRIEISSINNGSYNVGSSLQTVYSDAHYIFIFQDLGKSCFVLSFENVTVKGAGFCCVLCGQKDQLITAFEMNDLIEDKDLNINCVRKCNS